MVKCFFSVSMFEHVHFPLSLGLLGTLYRDEGHSHHRNLQCSDDTKGNSRITRICQRRCFFDATATRCECAPSTLVVVIVRTSLFLTTAPVCRHFPTHGRLLVPCTSPLEFAPCRSHGVHIAVRDCENLSFGMCLIVRDPATSLD